MDQEQEKKPIERLDGKGQLDLSHPEAIILDALGLARYQDVVADSRGVLSRTDLFGGPLDGGAWQAIQDYIATGSRGKLSIREQHYLDLLTLTYSLDGQYGKRNTLRFLTSPYFGLSHEQAAGLYSAAVEMFYANRNISKAALRNKTADQLEAAYIAAFAAARTAKDFKNAAEILKMRADVLGLEKDDVVVLDSQTYMRSYRILSLDPASIGLPAADRNALGQIIEQVVQEDGTEKRRLQMETGIIDMDIQEVLQNESQEAD